MFGFETFAAVLLVIVFVLVYGIVLLGPTGQGEHAARRALVRALWVVAVLVGSIAVFVALGLALS